MAGGINLSFVLTYITLIKFKGVHILGAVANTELSVFM